ncbi:MAG: hypothetical protein ACOY3E_12500 [Pseudomonadota bacterium]
MSPLLIFILVVLFIAGGLLLLRDTAFLKGKPNAGTRQRGSGSTSSSGSESLPAKTDKNADSHDTGSSDGGDGGGGD